MSKRLIVLSTLVLSLGLSACQGETEATVEEEEVQETAALDSDSSDLTDTDESADEPEYEVEADEDEESTDNYKAEIEQLLQQAEKQFEAEQFDAAGGTLSQLFQHDLSEYAELAEQADKLKGDIQSVQAEQADRSIQTSDFKEVRQSAILAEEFLNATGQPISEASDEDIKEWFNVKQDQSLSEDSGREWTKEEAENYAFDQLMILESLNHENYFFFVNLTEDDWVQLEAREAVEQDDVTWSNLIGLYRYNVSTDELQKLDTVTGEYDTFQNPS